MTQAAAFAPGTDAVRLVCSTRLFPWPIKVDGNHMEVLSPTSTERFPIAPLFRVSGCSALAFATRQGEKTSLADRQIFLGWDRDQALRFALSSKPGGFPLLTAKGGRLEAAGWFNGTLTGLRSVTPEKGDLSVFTHLIGKRVRKSFFEKNPGKVAESPVVTEELLWFLLARDRLYRSLRNEVNLLMYEVLEQNEPFILPAPVIFNRGPRIQYRQSTVAWAVRPGVPYAKEAVSFLSRAIETTARHPDRQGGFLDDGTPVFRASQLQDAMRSITSPWNNGPSWRLQALTTVALPL